MPGRYERDEDNIESILADTHEAYGRLGALIEVLTKHVTDLKTEVKDQPSKEDQ